MAGSDSLGIPPDNRGIVLSERSESKVDGGGAPGLPGGLHKPNRFAALPERVEFSGEPQYTKTAFRLCRFGVLPEALQVLITVVQAP
jgi:hypothetical protein